MSTYKNLEIYQAAFNLAIKTYRLNVSLPVTALLHQGNKLRWTSLKIKDLIAEGFSGKKSDEEIIESLVVRLSSDSYQRLLFTKLLEATIAPTKGKMKMLAAFAAHIHTSKEIFLFIIFF